MESLLRPMIKEEFLGRLFSSSYNWEQNLNPANINISLLHYKMLLDDKKEFEGDFITGQQIQNSSLTDNEKRLCLRLIFLQSYPFKLASIKKFKKKPDKLTKKEIEEIIDELLNKN